MADKRYFIVNPAGAVHEVGKDQAAELLKGVRGPGYRPATKEQVKAYMTPNEKFEKPIQDWREPIGEPWNPEPESVDVDSIFEEMESEAKAATKAKAKPSAKKE